MSERRDIKLAKFAGDRSGNFGITFVALSTLIVTVSAFAMETTRLASRQQVIQTVSDNAALYGAKYLADGTVTNEELTGMVKAFIMGQLEGKEGDAIDIDQTMIDIDRAAGSIRVSAAGSFTTMLPFIDLAPHAMTVVSQAGTAPASAEKGPALCGLAFSRDQDKAMNFKGDGVVQSGDCIFWSNSREKEATHGVGEGKMTTAQVCSVGKYGKLGGYSVLPPPEDNCLPMADPLTDWSAPYPVWSACTYGGNDAAVFDGGGYDVTLHPGTYCGGLFVSGARKVTFKPGRYFINGKTVIDANSSIEGTGLYLHFAGPDTEVELKTETISLSSGTDPALANGIIYLPGDTAEFKISRASDAPEDALSVLAQNVTWDIAKGNIYKMRPALAPVPGTTSAVAANAKVRLLK